jgi:hypothetical protein
MLGLAPDYDHLTVIQKVEVFEHALESTSGEDLHRVMWLKSRSSEARRSARRKAHCQPRNFISHLASRRGDIKGMRRVRGGMCASGRDRCQVHGAAATRH